MADIRVNFSYQRGLKKRMSAYEKTLHELFFSCEITRKHNDKAVYNQIAPLTKTLEISVYFCNDKEIKKLNRDYRGKNKPTNVLSFPQYYKTELAVILNHMEYRSSSEASTKSQPVYLGDIAISVETLDVEAVTQNKIFEHHLKHLACHGYLHLLGYDHEAEDEAEEMEVLEAFILNKFGIPNPYTTITN